MSRNIFRHRILALTVFATTFGGSLAARADEKPATAKPSEAQPAAKPEGQNPPAPSAAGAALVDFDVDGRVDLFVANSLAQIGAPAQPQALSEFWIGIDGTPPDDALRAQLEIPAGQGVLVNQVVDNSPASKAGLKQFDILLTCHEAALAEIADLARIIDEKKETVLPLRLIRGGKRLIIEVTPERRPAGQTGETCPSISKATDEVFARRVWLDLTGAVPAAEEIQAFVAEAKEKKRDQLVNRLLRRSTVTNKSCTACHATDGDTTRLWTDLGLRSHFQQYASWLSAIDANAHNTQQLWLPQAVIQFRPDVNTAAPQLADDLTISVSRKGQEPVHIVIRKGDRIWDVTDLKDREKVPEETRVQAAWFISSLPTTLGPQAWNINTARYEDHFLLNLGGGRFFDATVPFRVDVQEAAPQADQSKAEQPKAEQPKAEQSKPPAANAPANSEAALTQLDQQIESLSTQLAELRRAMQELRKSIKPQP
jgi:hypothetical protein